jgi:hypothetical protein
MPQYTRLSIPFRSPWSKRQTEEDTVSPNQQSRLIVIAKNPVFNNTVKRFCPNLWENSAGI